MKKEVATVINLFSDDWMAGDMWGAVHESMFTLCSWLECLGEEVPSSLGYRSGLHRPSLQDLMEEDVLGFYDGWELGSYSADDVREALDLMDKFVDRLRELGLDY